VLTWRKVEKGSAQSAKHKRNRKKTIEQALGRDRRLVPAQGWQKHSFARSQISV